jgi:hypothetical protein
VTSVSVDLSRKIEPQEALNRTEDEFKMPGSDLSTFLGMLVIPHSPIITLKPYRLRTVLYGPTLGAYWKYSELLPSPSPDVPLEGLYFDTLKTGDRLDRLKKLAYSNNLLFTRTPLDPTARRRRK